MVVDELVVDEHRRRVFGKCSHSLTVCTLVRCMVHNDGLVERMQLRDRLLPQQPFSVVVVRDAEQDLISILRGEGYLLIADHSLRCYRLAQGISWRFMLGGTSVWIRPLM